MLDYLILILINVNPFFGGKFLAVAYITVAKLNPFVSILIIIISEVLVCILIFYFAQYLSKFNFFKKKLSKVNVKWVKKGAYIGFFAGQFFVGTLFVSLILGLVENRRNDFLFFYVPLITSTICYTLIYYYLSSHGINLMKNLV
jgi:hypothetical protein